MTAIEPTEQFSEEDVAGHERTYRVFVRFMMWNVVAVAAALIFLAAWAG